MNSRFSEKSELKGAAVNGVRPLAALVATAGLGIALAGAPTPALAEQVAQPAQPTTTDTSSAEAALDGIGAKAAEYARAQQDDSKAVVEDAASSDAAASDSVTPSEGATGGAAAEGDKAATDGPSDGSAEGNKKPGQPEAGGPSTETDGSKADGSGSGAGGGVAEGGSGAKADGSGSESDAGAAEGEAGAKPGPAGAEAGAAAAPGAGLPSAAPAAPAATASGWHDGRYYGADGNLYTGWVVREDFVDEARGQGLQRYWLQDGAIQRDRTVETEKGWWVRVLRQGYVLRGAHRDAGGELYWADNDGRLWGEGWFVGDIGQGLQRYYVADGHHTEAEGYSTKGYAHYTTSKGYVLRGTHDNGRGRVYLADNDGRTVSGSGWVVTGAYTGGALQRYYVQNGAAWTSLFGVGNSHYYGLGGVGYVLRGVGNGNYGWMVADNDGKLAQSKWVVTSAFGQGLQRYWFGKDSIMAKNRLVEKSEGAGYWAWATDNGTILRTVWDNGKGRVFLADNDGRLAEGENSNGSGWLVTGKFTGGALQRYYIDSKTHAAKSGFFQVSGYGSIFGVGNAGYVMRGKSAWGKYVLLADNDGKLADKFGWTTTSKYDKNTQKYYIEVAYKDDSGSYFGAVTGFFTRDGVKAYGITGEGYVVRGKKAISGGVVLADSDGRLVGSDGEVAGWYVNGKYDGGGLQRYFLVATSDGYLYAKTGLFRVKDGELVTTGGDMYYGKLDAGYVARNETVNVNGGFYEADNDGKLDESFSWLSAAGRRAWDLIKNDYSKSGYYVTVDITNCRLLVFKGSAGAWTPIYDWACGVGSPNVGGYTPTGKFYINANDHHDWDNTSSGGPSREYYTSGVYYCTYFFLDAGIHSTVPGIPDDQQLGRPVSHGCVRIAYDNAKWFYENIPDGTAVRSYA